MLAFEIREMRKIVAVPSPCALLEWELTSNIPVR
jgi:hypothetical protein